MALINSAYVEQFRKLAADFLADGSRFADGKARACEDIQQGVTAWDIAHRVGITDICYGNTAKDLPGIDGCHDAHIKTALAAIFPNAVFKDKYHY